MRDYHDTLSLIEGYNTMFLSGCRYSERNQFIVNKEEEYYKTFEQKMTATGFNFTYTGEKYSKPIWETRKADKKLDMN